MKRMFVRLVLFGLLAILCAITFFVSYVVYITDCSGCGGIPEAVGKTATAIQLTNERVETLIAATQTAKVTKTPSND